jgi:tetratricopeptide (TPR) repeat protein
MRLSIPAAWRYWRAAAFSIVALLLIFNGIFSPAHVCARGQAEKSPRVLTVEKWREDLRFVVDKVKTAHRFPFTKVTKEAFEKAAADLDARLPSLSDHDVVVEMAALVAMLSDGHSRLSLPIAQGEAQGRAHTETPTPADRALLFRRYPVSFYLFNDGLFISGAVASHTEFIGSEVVRIGRMTATEALRAVRKVTNADNEMGHKLSGPMLLGLAEVCSACGVAEDMENLPVLIKDPTGKEREIVLEPQDPLTPVKYVQSFELPGRSVPLWIKNRTDPHWFEYLPDRRAVFCQVNAIQDKPGETMAVFAAKLADFIEANPVERLILDLRWNGGGNNYLNRSLILALTRSPKVNRFGHLFTLIGRTTFSAAMNLTSQLEQWTNTLFAGEPTGSTTSHYGDSRRHSLPNSGLTLRLSTIYWRDWTVNEKRPWIAPDIPAELSAKDHFAGIDPALEAVLAFQAPDDLAGQLLWAYDRGGFDAAYNRFYKFRTDPETARRDISTHLHRFGRALMERKRFGEAVRVFQQNASDHPDSFEAHLDLGEAYLGAGNPAEAANSLEKALSLKPDDAAAKALLEKAKSD